MTMPARLVTRPYEGNKSLGYVHNLFCLTVIDIASNIKIAVVAADLVKSHQPTIGFDLSLQLECSLVGADDAGNVFSAQAVLRLAF